MEKLFDSIAKGNCILFLGAGASVTTNHKYLSRELIEYYTDIANIPYTDHNGDIVDFVDKVFSISEYDRNDFDTRVSDWLGRNLKSEDFHLKSMLIPWKLIISTNIDTLIEESINLNKIEETFEILRSIREFSQKINANIKTKIVKLHGCISNIGEYPLLFSTKQFEDNNKFYDKIYSLLNQFSEETNILFIGYSFNDRFGKLFLNKFQDNLIGRHHYLVTPDVDTSDFNLKYLKSKKITPFKMDYESFIKEYNKWFEENKEHYNSKNQNKYLLPNNIKIPSHLISQIESFIIPINNSYNNEHIDPIQFYLGKEPNYQVIKDNFDVIKQEKTRSVKEAIIQKFKKEDLNCSVVFLTGSYGAGKSTFSYRLIKEIITENEDVLAFEIIDYNKININLIKTLLGQLKDISKIIIYSDFTDLEYNFKKLRELRGEINAEQYQDKNIILLQSIRENRLETFKRKFNIKNIEEIDVNSKFNYSELDELLTKLNQKDVIKLKDEKSKQNLIKDILVDQNLNDPLTIFLKIIKNGSHSRYILDAYNQFDNEDTKKAFKYTCLLYQYGIRMPIGTLKNLISTDFEEFKDKVLLSDGKGILIQEDILNDKHLLPNLYFKVRHKILAKSFVDNFYRNNNTLFDDIRKIVESLSSDSYSTKLFIGLIKELTFEKKIDTSKIERLFEIAFKQIGLDKQFLVHFTKNLEHRTPNRIGHLSRAIELIESYELNEDLTRNYYSRDEYLIHRKACLKIELAKSLYNTNDPYYLNEYNDAIELFDIKLSLSPDSIFSYKNYIKALLWYDEIIQDNKEKTVNEIKIYKLINKAISNLEENGDEIIRLRSIYNRSIDINNLLERIDSLYENLETRPYALLMKIEYFNSTGTEISSDIIEEIQDFSHIDEVSEFLFYYKANRLYNPNDRMDFYHIIKNNTSIIERNKLDYLYFSYIAEIYNRNFKDAFNHQKDIRLQFPSAINKNPQYFIDSETEEKLKFTGNLVKQGYYYNLKLNNHGFFMIVRINNKKYDFKELKDKDVNAYIYFDYTGLWADILEADE